MIARPLLRHLEPANTRRSDLTIDSSRHRANWINVPDGDRRTGVVASRVCH
jgi:hypothetical protein